MAVQKITKRVVDGLEPNETYYFVWDSDVSGFGIRVWPSGKKTYVVQYRQPGLGRRGVARRITLGDHGALAPEEARKLAKRELGKVAQGENPAEDRAKRKAGETVSELGVNYLKDVKVRRKASTAREYERMWQKHVLPRLGKKQVASVSSQEIAALHRSLHETPYTANRVLALLGAFFTFAAREGLRPAYENPARAIEAYEETPRERFLTPAEFKRLGEALTRAETVGLSTAPEYAKIPKSEKTKRHRAKSTWGKPVPANPYAVAAIRLLALTGCRENEIIKLTWEQVDLERGYLRLADTKTGASVRPIGKTVVSILEAIPKVDGNPHVLPGFKEGQHLGDVQRLWYAVRHAAMLPDLRLHDLRHSYASVPAASGESMLVLRSLLGHKNVATTERYAHLGEDPVRRAADNTSERIAALLSDS